MSFSITNAKPVAQTQNSSWTGYLQNALSGTVSLIAGAMPVQTEEMTKQIQDNQCIIKAGQTGFSDTSFEQAKHDCISNFMTNIDTKEEANILIDLIDDLQKNSNSSEVNIREFCTSTLSLKAKESYLYLIDKGSLTNPSQLKILSKKDRSKQVNDNKIEDKVTNFMTAFVFLMSPRTQDFTQGKSTTSLANLKTELSNFTENTIERKTSEGDCDESALDNIVSKPFLDFIYVDGKSEKTLLKIREEIANQLKSNKTTGPTENHHYTDKLALKKIDDNTNYIGEVNAEGQCSGNGAYIYKDPIKNSTKIIDGFFREGTSSFSLGGFIPLFYPTKGKISIYKDGLSRNYEGKISHEGKVAMSEKAKIQFLNDDVYEGDINIDSLLPDGFGTLILNNQNKLNGEFKDNQFKGTIEFFHGLTLNYNGPIINNLLSTSNPHDDIPYSLEFIDNEIKLTTADGTILQGAPDTIIQLNGEFQLHNGTSSNDPDCKLITTFGEFIGKFDSGKPIIGKFNFLNNEQVKSYSGAIIHNLKDVSPYYSGVIELNDGKKIEGILLLRDNEPLPIILTAKKEIPAPTEEITTQL